MKKSSSASHTKISLITNSWFNKNLGFLGVVVVILVLIVYMVVMRMDSMDNRIIRLEGNDIQRSINELNGTSPAKNDSIPEKDSKMMKY